MKYIFFLFPFILFCQNTTLVGDVDCSGDVTSEDASLILQFVTNVIEELPCVENLNGLTPDQLQEIIDLINNQIDQNEQVINEIGPMYSYSEYGDLVDEDYNEAAVCCNELYYFEALLFCSKLEYNGFNDWRLPTLKSIHNWISTNYDTTLPIPNLTNGGIFHLNVKDASNSERASHIYIGSTGNVLYYHHSDNVQHRKCFCVR